MSLVKEFTKKKFEALINTLEKKDVEELQKSYTLNTEKQLYTIDPEILNNPLQVNKLEKILSSKTNNDKTSQDNETQSLKKNLEELTQIQKETQTKLHNYENTIKRQHAEFQNYRKRVEKEKEQIINSATQKLIESLLPIIDSLEKSIELSNKDSDINQFREGIILIEKQIHTILKQHGLEQIESLGEEFDPNKHEALQIDTSNNSYKVSTIIKEWQKGFMLNDKVIRHSKVVVAHPASDQQNNTPEQNNSSEDIENFKDILVFSKKGFEEDILKQLTDEMKQFIQESYEQKDSRYTLKNIYTKDTRRIYKIQEIVKNIQSNKKNLVK